MRLQIVGEGLVQTNGKDRDVALTELLHSLIESVLGKGIHAARKDHDRLFALYVLEPVGSVEQGVEHVGLTESRKIEVIYGIAHLVLVLCEVDFQAWLHIEGDQRDPILLFQVREQSIRPIFSVIRKPPVGSRAE